MGIKSDVPLNSMIANNLLSKIPLQIMGNPTFIGGLNVFFTVSSAKSILNVEDRYQK